MRRLDRHEWLWISRNLLDQRERGGGQVGRVPGRLGSVTVSDHRDLVTALLGVDGVADAALEQGEDDGGLGSLRLQLTPGADEVAVAGAVNRLLRAQFGLAVDTDRVRVLEEPRGVPRTAPGPARDTVSAAPSPPTADFPAEDGAGPPSGGVDAEPTPAPRESPLPSAPTAPRSASTLPRVQLARPGRLTIQRV